ncbi:MAG: metallophosphoesterase [Deltaproteobacteria bacterium]|uniref:Metallophosphoesterase n=1 Tax=Candidatus Zymogenus saltonus TaxID=2844893 RepID=A0A9D8KBI3_9DELT|nr:metallophosphoesterase [Candidatus Zymogenus saltonus]
MDKNLVDDNSPWSPGRRWRIAAVCFLLFALSGISFAAEDKGRGPVVVYGDSRYGHAVHERIVDAFMTLEPAAVFNTGDLVTISSNVSQWNRYNEIVSRIRAESAFYPVRGNHDGSPKTFLTNAGVPGDLSWYSVDRNGIHFIVLDSGSDIGPGSAQYLWFMSDLENLPDGTKFIVPIFHHPIFASEAGGHTADEKGWGEILLPIFGEHGVRLVFAGHVHAYERLRYNDIHFVTTGGGGAPLYARKKASDYSELYVRKHHFCTVTASGNILEVNVFDIDLLPIDSFDIQY